MTFLDEQGVGPCGHAAKDKGILINVHASCLSHQIPRKLAFSVVGCKTDKESGFIISNLYSSVTLDVKNRIADSQHARGMNFTNIMCGKESIDKECLCVPGATWKKWSERERIYIVTGMYEGEKAWNMVLLDDDDETTLQFIELTHGANSGQHVVDGGKYGTIVGSGFGNGPTAKVFQSVMKTYEVYRARK